MKKIIKLTENDLTNIIKTVIKEYEDISNFELLLNNLMKKYDGIVETSNFFQKMLGYPSKSIRLKTKRNNIDVVIGSNGSMSIYGEYDQNFWEKKRDSDEFLNNKISDNIGKNLIYFLKNSNLTIKLINDDHEPNYVIHTKFSNLNQVEKTINHIVNNF